MRKYPNDTETHTFEGWLLIAWDIETSIGLMFLPSVRDYFRYLWE